ncbi:phosphoribosyl-AMP cyclohydrolase [Corynebacterium choanae]|uniref:Phosphoribosyl-AMP cyclohydrolase n=1 Tax=Corynebacterium choanae TaxID=1862358 RepID=A0A3G6J4K1_9CORY|nr:phosphoribosyl-AMP cyclohydrolase [Corynebacterium choanae]AZA13005.1 phosphoribosyl-AMP cyclohydrolase [Corynebacterium choanae]
MPVFDGDLQPADALLDPAIANLVTFNEQGLVPCVVQDATSKRVLMMAWMDDHALAYTLATRRGTYYSRSRQEYWVKGLTSGNTQYVRQVAVDCDGDTVLLTIDQQGGACHTGATSCFDTATLLTDPAGR